MRKADRQNAAKKLHPLRERGRSALSAKAGQNKVRFQGRLSGSKQPQARQVPRRCRRPDAAGNQSQPRNGPTFTIVNE